jgi:hypothetical protein
LKKLLCVITVFTVFKGQFHIGGELNNWKKETLVSVSERNKKLKIKMKNLGSKNMESYGRGKIRFSQPMKPFYGKMAT